MISFSHLGDFKKTEQFLRKLQKLDIGALIESEAQKGVEALRRATPRDSGLAAYSWGYNIVRTPTSVTINWTNSDIENGFKVALMIQYGHGTGTGGWVPGIDYINPAMRPVFEQIAQTVWKAVKSA